MSEWGIQHVKIELANEEGERLIINQDPGGRVTCQPGHTRGAGKDSAAAPASKPSPGAAASKPDKAPAAKPAEEPAKTEARAAPRRTAKPAAAKPEAAKPEAAKPEGRKPARRKASSLQWKPVSDTGYHGFAAKSEGGAFKLLKAKNSQWALFFERPGQKTVPLGCFKEDAPGRVTAQELHDKGTYRVEPEPITEYRIINVCPAVPDEPAAPSPEAADESTPEVIAPNAETDAEMMASLKRALEEV